MLVFANMFFAGWFCGANKTRLRIYAIRFILVGIVAVRIRRISLDGAFGSQKLVHGFCGQTGYIAYYTYYTIYGFLHYRQQNEGKKNNSPYEYL